MELKRTVQIGLPVLFSLLLAQELWPVLYMIPLFGIFLLPLILIFWCFLAFGCFMQVAVVRDFLLNKRNILFSVFLFTYIIASWIAGNFHFLNGFKKYLAEQRIAEIQSFYNKHSRLPDQNHSFKSLVYPGMQLKYHPDFENNHYRLIYPLHPMEETYYVSEDKNWYFGD